MKHVRTQELLTEPPAQIKLSETLSLAEAAARLGISLSVARKAARAGDIPVIRFRRRFLVLRKRFQRMLNEAIEAAENKACSLVD